MPKKFEKAELRRFMQSLENCQQANFNEFAYIYKRAADECQSKVISEFLRQGESTTTFALQELKRLLIVVNGLLQYQQLVNKTNLILLDALDKDLDNLKNNNSKMSPNYIREIRAIIPDELLNKPLNMDQLYSDLADLVDELGVKILKHDLKKYHIETAREFAKAISGLLVPAYGLIDLLSGLKRLSPVERIRLDVSLADYHLEKLENGLTALENWTELCSALTARLIVELDTKVMRLSVD